LSWSAFFIRELSPTHRRIAEAARNATKATLTTGLAASMQIAGPFGPLFAFRIGQPGVSLGLFDGALVIICAAAMQAAVVPITGKLLDYPGLILAFLFAVFASIAYLLSNTRLFLPLALVAIGTITTLYVGIFEPGAIGWGSTYTFDGILLATLVMVALDQYIWPSPPEPRLLESIAADLIRTRRRFELASQRYLDPSLPPLTTPPARSVLAPNLALLNSIEAQMKPAPGRFAALLEAVLTSEHIYLEIERLAVLADESVTHDLRKKFRTELTTSLRSLDATLAQRIEHTLAGLLDIRETEQWVSDLRLTIARLSELKMQASLATDESTMLEAMNFLGFVGVLEIVAHLMEPHVRPPLDAGAEGTKAEDKLREHPFFDPARLRFSIKLGATITLGLLVGLTAQRADLQTILWSIAVAGQPNQYGAIVRKTALRLAGCIAGGLAALAAMLVVSQNFDSLPPYLAAIFAITMFSTYVSQSSEWLSYAGIQTGITFLICYVGLAPSTDIYRPLWRFWGIVLGLLTTGFVYLFLWPEYAGQKVIESLIKLTKSTLDFAKDVSEERINDGRITAVEYRLSENLLELLNLAEQAKLEGRRSSASSAAVEAAGLLIRIAYRFAAIARQRLTGWEVALPQNVREHCATLERDYCSALECGLQKLNLTGSSQQSTSTPATLRRIDLTPIHQGLVNELLDNRDLSSYSNLALQIESYHRISALLPRLDTALSEITVC
jgi:uncharacterized membrane protein YccC